MRWETILAFAEPSFLVALLLGVGLPLTLLPSPAGPMLAGLDLAALLWLNHHIDSSTRRLPVRVGPESLPGQSVVVLEALDPDGMVRCAGEAWRAVEIEGRRVAAGEQVQVVRVQGLRLLVEARPTAA